LNHNKLLFHLNFYQNLLFSSRGLFYAKDKKLPKVGGVSIFFLLLNLKNLGGGSVMQVITYVLGNGSIAVFSNIQKYQSNVSSLCYSRCCAAMP
jgi:hypothetical protein